MELGLVSEEWGGDTIFVDVSAKKRVNLPTLLEMVLLQADVLELKANEDKAARGTIVEAKLDKGRGPVATVLVQEGTLKVGDYFVAGIHFGRVRAMQNDRAEKVLSAGPSMPVEVIGFTGVPDAGDVFVALADEKQAKEIASLRQQKVRETELAKHSKLSLEQLYEKIQMGEVKDLNTIVKGDVQGSVEAVSESLRKLSTDASVSMSFTLRSAPSPRPTSTWQRQATPSSSLQRPSRGQGTDACRKRRSRYPPL